MAALVIAPSCCRGIHAKDIELDERWEPTVNADQAVIVIPGYRINLTGSAAGKLHRMLGEYMDAQVAMRDED